MLFVAQEKPGFTVRVAPGLKTWLEGKARWIPHERGPGKRKGENLSKYVEMILEAHRKDQKLDAPTPPSLPSEDQTVLDAIRGLRERRRPLFDAILSLAETAVETEESAQAVEAVAALVARLDLPRARGGRARRG